MNSEYVQAEALTPTETVGDAVAEGDLSPQPGHELGTARKGHAGTARFRQADLTPRSGHVWAVAGKGPVLASPPRRGPILAFKFGGTSLLGAGRMLHAAGLVRPFAQSSQVVVVVSAMKGVTDRLLAIAQLLAERKNQQARAEAEGFLCFHQSVLEGLGLDVKTHDRLSYELDSLGRDLLHEVPAHERVAATPELFDRLASFGERFSARLFAVALERTDVAAVPVCSSDFVVTCDTFRDAKPQLEHSKRRGREILVPLLEDGIVPVVTGFIGATTDGRMTTLGRNSSDFSGAIVAHVVDADELVIWTDVDGIYTANPNESAQAQLLHDLSYEEAHTLAANGARVLHPHVLPLAAETEMTVWVRNTFKPQARGTRIGVIGRSNSSLHRAQQEGAE
jgi:bifunctional aspartokinase / homoserine dehydrogenase 1